MNYRSCDSGGHSKKIEDMLVRLKGPKYFTDIDLQREYYHISLASETKHESAFTTIFGKYEFMRMPLD